jgi:hypothetical protein
VTSPARRPGPEAVGGGLAVLAAVGYLLTVPPVPDLAAQTAREHLAEDAGIVPWWGRWYGGLHTPGYSLLAPPLLRLLGPAMLGALATTAAVVLFAGVLRVGGVRRPRLGAALFAATMTTNLFAGRTTFALGCAVGLAAVRLVATPARPRRRLAAAGALASATSLASPVAGLFLGVAGAALVLTDRSRRPAGFALGLGAAVPVLLVAGLFPQPGRMPFTRDALRPPLLGALGLAAALPGRTHRLARTGALLAVFLVLLAYLLPSPVGSNAERLAMLAGAPVLAACSPLPRLAVAALLVPLLLFPWQSVSRELHRAGDASARADYYAPLLAALADRERGSPQRVEVIDPRTHWSSAYVARRVPLARGWERQADAALHPIFYGRAPLTAGTYRRFLDDYAVAWVALPDAPLDFAAVAEAALVRGGLRYLAPVWRGEHWTLYAVRDPAPLATGAARVTAVEPAGLRLLADSPGTADLRLRWSPWLSVRDGRGCVQRRGEWARLVVRTPGELRVSASWWPPAAPAARLTAGRC